MSYTLYFIGHSFQSQLPWERCDPEWATGTNCSVRSKNVNPLINYCFSFQEFNEI